MSSETKVVLITGGSAGIGESTAMKFAESGYKVAITGRNAERLNKVLDSMAKVTQDKEKSNLLTIQADFEDQDQVDEVVKKVIEKFQRLDVVVNNAGYAGNSSVTTVNDADFYDNFQKVVQVNLVAAVRIAQLALPHLKKTKGVIVNISSIADRMPMPSVSYNVSKAGLSMMTKALACEVGGKGIRVVGVAPGPIVTNFASGIERAAPLTCLGRAGRPEEVAELIFFLASDKASYIHGSTVDIDGGMLVKFGGADSSFKEILEQQQQ